MRTRYKRKLVSGALGLIVLGCLWFYLAPVSLGGSTTYVITDGVSMQPRFHTGDLALVRSQGSYHVGEIAAYYNKMLHTVVLHRIVGRSGARYLFKGDNNNFVDFEHPTASQLIGALWVQIPSAGAHLRSISSPLLTGILVAIGMLLFSAAAFTRHRRRRRRQIRAGEGDQRALRASQLRPVEPVIGVLAIGLVALLPFLALALLAFTRPATALRPFEIPYKQTGKFSYTANAAAGPAYPGDRATTGDPLFTRVLNGVDVRFAYQFAAATKHSLAGKVSLAAAVSSTSGWQTTFPLGAPTFFRGDRALVTANLDLNSLVALMRRVEKATAVSGSYTLALVPHVSAAGSLDLIPVSAQFSPRLQFSLNELELQPVAGAGGSSAAGSSTASPFASSVSGSATGRRYQPLFLSLRVARLSVATARTIALGAIAILVLILLAVVGLMRPRPRDESAAIRARYGRLIIEVARVWRPPGVAVIDVADIDALVRIAEHYDRSILYEAAEGGDAFWVTDESGQFRYALGETAWSEQREGVDDAPPEQLVGDVHGDGHELDGLASSFPSQAESEFPVADDAWLVQEPVNARVREEDAWSAAQTADHVSATPPRDLLALLTGIE